MRCPSGSDLVTVSTVTVSTAQIMTEGLVTLQVEGGLCAWPNPGLLTTTSEAALAFLPRVCA